MAVPGSGPRARVALLSQASKPLIHLGDGKTRPKPALSSLCETRGQDKRQQSKPGLQGRPHNRWQFRRPAGAGGLQSPASRGLPHAFIHRPRARPSFHRRPPPSKEHLFKNSRVIKCRARASSFDHQSSCGGRTVFLPPTFPGFSLPQLPLFFV